MSASSLDFPRRAPRAAAPVLDVDVVVPVFNEEAALERSIRRLHRFLAAEFPFRWRIVIADNASTDATPAVAAALAATLPGVDVLRLERKGRGRALRAAWSASPARVVAYMDVDLSTDLRALLPLVAPLLSGHSELAIGTRLGNGSRVVRGPKRELISRAYNRLLHTALRVRFSDAQCGFKAVRRDVLDELLAGVADDGWFFDTELLVLAQRRGLRIHEVPVDWVDDPDSRVRIVRTAIDDLRGVARLAAASPVARFMAVGVVSTLLYALRLPDPARPARPGHGERRRARAHGDREHGRQPPLHVRRARPRAAAAPPRAGRRRVRAHPRAHQRRAARAARARAVAAAARRGRGAHRREHDGDRHPLRRAQGVGVRPRPAPARGPGPFPDPALQRAGS